MKALNKNQFVDLAGKGLLVRYMSHHESEITLIIVCKSQAQADELINIDSRNGETMSGASWHDVVDADFVKYIDSCHFMSFDEYK